MTKIVIHISLYLACLIGYSQLTVTHSVYFDLDQDQFSFSEGKQLNAFFDDLIYKPILDVNILGYCDDRGSNSYNLDLSNRRVETVNNWLQQHKITTDHIFKNIKGLGEIALESSSLNDKQIDQQRAENRRVDITFSLSEAHTERTEIKKLRKKNLTTVEADKIEAYEQRVVENIQKNPNSTSVIKIDTTTTQAITNHNADDYLDIPTKIEPPVDNNQEPFHTLLKKNLKKGQVIRLENILFYKGRSTVTPDSEQLLERVAEILAARKDIHFEIHGHVCCINPSYPDAYNRDTKKSNLSHARAKEIYKVLRKRGIHSSRMKYKGYGRTRPLGGLDRLDRRVEFVITRIDTNG